MQINFKISSKAKRFFAAFIDEILLSLIFYISFFEQLQNKNIKELVELFATHYIGYYSLLQILYQTLFVWIYGGSIGKIILKIKCVNLIGQKPTLYESMIRSVTRFCGMYFLFYINFIWAYFDKLNRTLQDIISGVLVVEA